VLTISCRVAAVLQILHPQRLCEHEVELRASSHNGPARPADNSVAIFRWPKKGKCDAVLRASRE
jgi:hypothetical protein